MSNKTIKIKMVTNHLQYKKGQILDLKEEQAINFLTNGKALRIHRQESIAENKTTEIVEEKPNKKSKKNDQ